MAARPTCPTGIYAAPPLAKINAGGMMTLTDNIKTAAAADPEGAYSKLGIAFHRVKRTAKSIAVLCPLHDETSPSFTITLTGPHAGKFKCFGCGAKGSVIDFVKLRDQLGSDGEAVHKTAELLGLSAAVAKPPGLHPEAPTDRDVVACHAALLADGDRWTALLADRHLTPDIIDLRRLGYDVQTRRYTLPVYDGDQNLLDVRLYLLGHKPGQPKMLPWKKGLDTGAVLYGYEEIKHETVLVFTEGETDALALVAAGIPAFACTLGAGKWPRTDPDLTGKAVYLVGDRDKSGREHNAVQPANLYRSGAEQVFVVKWPEGEDDGMDPCAYFEQGQDADGFRALLAAAKLVPKPKPSRDLETAQDLFDNPEPPARWQVEGMIERGSLVTMAGKSKSRKSFMSLQLVQAVGTGGYFLGRKCERGKVLYVPLEDGRRRVQSRLITQQQNNDNKLDDQTRQNIIFRYAEQWVPLNKPEGCQTIRDLIGRHGLDLIVIDPWAAAKTGKLDENIAGEMADILNDLRGIAQGTDCTIMFVHHHHKLATGDAILDMSGSTAIGAAADVILGVYVDKKKHESRIVVEGRDADDIELIIEFERDELLWRPLGDASKVAASQAERDALAALTKIGKTATADTVSEVVGVHVRAIRAPLELLVDKRLLWRREVRSGGKGRPPIFYGLADWPEPQDMTLTEEK